MPSSTDTVNARCCKHQGSKPNDGAANASFMSTVNTKVQTRSFFCSAREQLALRRVM